MRRGLNDQATGTLTAAVYHDHKGRAGSPRITWALRHEGWRVGKNRVARLMRQNALRAKAARKSLPAAMAGQGNDQLRSQSAGGPQPAEPGLQRATTEPEVVGSRHNVFSHGRRLVVSGRGARPLHPQGRGVGHV